MKNDPVFDPKLLNSLQGGKIKYFIGVDTYDKNALAYCLGKQKDGDFELLLAKTMNDEEQFKEEVTNLAKYFNAKIGGEFD